MFDHAMRDVRHALRTIRRTPVSSAVIVLSLALAIGVNTAVFSWIDARFLHPVPGVANGANIYLVEPRNDAGLYTGTSWLDYRDLRASARAFQNLFASRMVPLYVGTSGQVDRVFGLLVSDNYFSALGLKPRIGRFLTAGRSTDPSFARDLAARTSARLRGLPGVEHAAIALSVPLDIHGMPSRGFTVDGHLRSDDGADEALTNVVTPGYFDVMGIPVKAGRDFADLADADAPPQAIVNEEFVRRFVRRGEPVGRGLEARGRRFVIIGVVANSLYDAFGEPPTPMIYFSYRDMPQSRGEIHLRTRGQAPASLGPEIRRVMRELDGELPVFNVRPMNDHVETNLIFRRIPVRMFAVLGPMLLLLAGIGIYAVVAYAVAVRRTEIAIRIALGGTAWHVVRQFVSEHMTAIGLGALAGWIAAILLAWRVGAAGSSNVAVFAVVPAILLTIALIACSLPAWRAAKASSSNARVSDLLA